MDSLFLELVHRHVGPVTTENAAPKGLLINKKDTSRKGNT